jgi:hypothetical protein
MYYVPNNVNVETYKGDPDKLGAVPNDTDPSLLSLWGKIPGEEYQQVGSNNPWHQNPYWTAYQMQDNSTRDRVIASGQLRYNFTDWLYAQARVGLDWYTRRQYVLTPQGTGYQRGGATSVTQTNVSELNAEWIVGVDKLVGPININAFVGANYMRHHYENLNLSGNGFNVPFFPALNNTVSRNWGYGFSKNGINSMYGSVELGYKGFLYLTGTGRQDWFSVLDPAHNHIFYPSIGGSFVFSEAFTMPQAISFGKVRASWAQVGGATVNPYSTTLTYSLNGNPHLGYTMASFSSAMGNNGTIPNSDLVPLTSTELEFGLDIRFLENRLGIDFSYYSQKTTKDQLNATISRSSGFGSTTVNVGELTNKGIEVLITGTPIKSALTWDMSLNLAHNTNKVVALIEGVDELVIGEPRFRNTFIKHIVGHPFGEITGRTQLMSPDGQPVFFANGSPVGTSGFDIIGNGVPTMTGGFENTFTFKNFNLDVLIDFKFGGDILSGTNMRMTSAGFTKRSLQGREGEAPLHVTGVTQTGVAGDGSPVYGPIDRDLTPSEARSYWGSVQGDANGITPMWLYDASFAKLRSVTFGYNFPQSIMGNLPIQNLSLSFVARNLAILFKNVPNIDPESSYNNTNAQGFDYFGFPSTKTYGFNLRATF